MTRRLAALLALAWYLGAGLGLPLADSVLYHDDVDVRGAHIEDIDNECHREECSLEAPGAPQAPAALFEFSSLDLLPVEVLAAAPESSRELQAAVLSHHARAPPSLA
jgi:hypothetical protein